MGPGAFPTPRHRHVTDCLDSFRGTGCPPLDALHPHPHTAAAAASQTLQFSNKVLVTTSPRFSHEEFPWHPNLKKVDAALAGVTCAVVLLRFQHEVAQPPPKRLNCQTTCGVWRMPRGTSARRLHILRRRRSLLSARCRSSSVVSRSAQKTSSSASTLLRLQHPRDRSLRVVIAPFTLAELIGV